MTPTAKDLDSQEDGMEISFAPTLRSPPSIEYDEVTVLLSGSMVSQRSSVDGPGRGTSASGWLLAEPLTSLSVWIAPSPPAEAATTLT